jgi:pimeloyl-ACP methyl ester carboxylesterase
VNDRTSKTLSLESGRRLAYAEYGAPDGSPLIYFHGTPGSRRECSFDATVLQALNIRVIVPERPGYGLSDFQENRCILDWPDDVAQLADSLGLDCFAVLGFSCGGSYALACSHRLGARITATGLLGCVAPLNTPGMWDAVSPAFRGMYELAAKDPGQLEQQLAPAAASPEGVLAMVEEAVSTPDKATFTEPVFREKLLVNVTEALRQGAKAVVWDLHLAALPWGFNLTDVQQPVQLWHGTDDLNAAVAMGHYLADTLPHCSARFMANEGHYSLFNHMAVILQKLMNS